MNSTTDRVTSASLTINESANNTFAAWFNPAQTTTSFVDIVISQPSQVDVIWAMSAAHMQYRWGGGSITGTATYVANAWNHAAMVATGGTTFAGYLNGVADGTATPTGPGSGTSTIQCGNDSFGSGNPVNSTILADVAWWTAALTAAEVAALALGARPWMIRRPNLQLWWTLDGLQSPEPDLSGNARNGTLTGTIAAPGPPLMPFTPRWPQFNLLPVSPFTLMPQIVT